MVRTQIQLTERQARQLRTRAHEEGVSLAELIRRCVERGLAEESPDRHARYERAARLIGRFGRRTGPRRLSSRHDQYLDEAYE